MDLLKNFKETENVGRIQNTLFEIALRDAVENPDYYKETEIQADLNALNFLLTKIQELPSSETE